MVAIAFESVVKLFALLCLALMAYWLLLPEKIGVSQFVEHASHLQYNTEHTSWLSFAVKTLLAMTAIFLLPRQFHVAFVENVDHRHLRHAKRWYSSYLFLVTLVVIPIALAGMHLFPGQEHLADSFVLLIPEKSGWHTLSVLVFIGGFSAATSMIIISTLALSTMISNDVVMPTILRRPGHGQRIKDYSGLILLVRRTMIITVMLLSYGYYALFARNYELAETGLLAFALAIQLAPAVVGGLYWRHGNAFGVYAGLAVGFTLWFFCLMVPQLSAVGVLEQTLLQQGLFGIEALETYCVIWGTTGYLKSRRDLVFGVESVLLSAVFSAGQSESKRSSAGCCFCQTDFAFGAQRSSGATGPGSPYRYHYVAGAFYWCTAL